VKHEERTSNAGLRRIIKAPCEIVKWMLCLYALVWLFVPWPFSKGAYYHGGLWGWLISIWP
jgi:hypothetical protein